MTEDQAQYNALFFLTLFVVWYGAYWLFFADFPGLPGVKRFQLMLGLWRSRKARRKHYKVCAAHAALLRPGELGDLVPGDFCQFCIRYPKERISR